MPREFLIITFFKIYKVGNKIFGAGQAGVRHPEYGIEFMPFEDERTCKLEVGPIKEVVEK